MLDIRDSIGSEHWIRFNFALSTALILRRKDVEEKRHLEEEF